MFGAVLPVLDLVAALLVPAFVVALPLLVTGSPGSREHAGPAIGGAGVLLTAAFASDPGLGAVLLTGPWVLLSIDFASRQAVGTWRGGRPSGLELALAAAGAFWVTGSMFALVDRADLRPFGLDQPIIRLTVAHFHVAGVALVLAAVRAHRRRPSRALAGAIACLIAGIGVTALGFLGPRVVNWAGAMLVAAGALGIAVAHVHAAVAPRPTTERSASSIRAVAARLLIGTAGLGLFVSTPLAIAYATARLLGAGGPSLGLMAGVHGAVNVGLVALPAAVGWWLAAPRKTRTSQARFRDRSREGAEIVSVRHDIGVEPTLAVGFVSGWHEIRVDALTSPRNRVGGARSRRIRVASVGDRDSGTRFGGERMVGVGNRASGAPGASAVGPQRPLGPGPGPGDVA